jgi:hypothetical protein
MAEGNKFTIERIEAFAYDNFLADWDSVKLKRSKTLPAYYLEKYKLMPERRDSVVYILEMMAKHYNRNKLDDLSGTILFPEKLAKANEILSKTPPPKE